MSEIKGRDPEGKYKVEVIADSSDVFVGNGVRFDTKENAEEYARDLMWRWTLVREWRVMHLAPRVSEGVMWKEVSRG